MSTHLPASAAEGRVTRSSDEEAGSSPPLTTSAPAPVLPTLRASLPTGAVESTDAKEDNEEPAADSDSDPDVEHTSEDDELALLLRDSARLKSEEAALTAQRVAKLRRDNERRKTRIVALQQADADVDLASASAATASTAGEQTPSRAPQPRRALFQSATGRKPPNANSVARQASIDKLPDVVPGNGTVSVVIAPRHRREWPSVHHRRARARPARGP